MSFYKFSAIRENNDDIVSGVLEAKDEAEAIAQIKKEFASIVSLEQVAQVPEKGISEDTKSLLRKISLRGHRITMDEKAIFFRKLAMLITAGMTNAEAIMVLKENEANLALKQILKQIFASVKRGSSLSVAVAQFPEIFGRNVLALLQIGDKTGHMEEALKNIADYLDEVANSRKNMSAALAYPMFLLASFLIVFFVVVLYCVPKFERAFDPIIRRGTLPLASRIIFAVSNFIRGHYFICILCVVLPMTFVCYKLRKKWQDKFYFIPMVRKYLLAGAMKNLSLLISSNIPSREAAELVAAESNCSQIKRIFTLAAEALNKGEAIDIALGEHLSKIDKSLLSIGLTGARLGEVCSLIASQYKTEAEALQKKILSLLEPSLVFLIGGLVALVALGIYLPCIKMIEEISM